jgi:hypothetical protein
MPSALDQRPIFYTYILFDWLGTPKYVGKGKNGTSREFTHERRSDPINWMKNEFIERTWIMLSEIPKIKIREDVNEADALAAEIAFIKAIGRFPNGPLVNMTDGGDGFGKLSPEQYKARGRKSADALSPEERRNRARRRVATMTPEARRAAAAKSALKRDMKKYGKIYKQRNTAMTPEKRREKYRSDQSKTPEQHRKYARKAVNAQTPEQLSNRSKKANVTSGAAGRRKRVLNSWMTRRRNMKLHPLTSEQKSSPAYKGWETRRNNGTQTNWSASAKKGWETKKKKRYSTTEAPIVSVTLGVDPVPETT